MTRANRSLTLRQAQGPVILILLVVLSGCSLLPYANTPLPTPPPVSTPSAAPAPTGPACDNATALRSYAPDGPLPEAGADAGRVDHGRDRSSAAA